MGEISYGSSCAPKPTPCCADELGATDWESIGEKQHHQSMFQEGNSDDSETGQVTYGAQEPQMIHEVSHPKEGTKEMTQEKVTEVV